MKRTMLLSALLACATPCLIHPSQIIEQQELPIEDVALRLSKLECFEKKSAYINKILYNKEIPIATKISQIEQIATYLNQELSLHTGLFDNNDSDYVQWICAEQIVISYKLNNLRWQIKSEREKLIVYGIHTSLAFIGICIIGYATQFLWKSNKNSKDASDKIKDGSKPVDPYQKNSQTAAGNQHNNPYKTPPRNPYLGKKKLDESDVWDYFNTLPNSTTKRSSSCSNLKSMNSFSASSSSSATTTPPSDTDESNVLAHFNKTPDSTIRCQKKRSSSNSDEITPTEFLSALSSSPMTKNITNGRLFPELNSYPYNNQQINHSLNDPQISRSLFSDFRSDDYTVGPKFSEQFKEAKKNYRNCLGNEK